MKCLASEDFILFLIVLWCGVNFIDFTFKHTYLLCLHSMKMVTRMSQNMSFRYSIMEIGVL